MKKFLLFLFLVSSISQVGAFSDIESNWYKYSIIELEELEIINGFEDDTFRPENTITRAEVLKIILSAANTQIQQPEESCFSDVSLDAWEAKYICGAYEEGITKGYEDGRFKPSGRVTVLETIAFGARAFDLDVDSMGEGDEWYHKYQAFAHIKNIIPIHSYTINTSISRGQAAELINRMRKYSDNQKLDYQSLGCEISPDLKTGKHSLNINGQTREYLLYVPSNISKNAEKGLIVAFHGRTNSNDMVRDYMQLGGGSYGKTKNQQDFIIAYPAGMGGGPYSWSQYENIEFFDAIITQVSDKLCVDRNAVFSAGHSLGSYMSNKVSCQRGDVIRAMAGVASDGFSGDCTGPVASLITHLPGDHLASYQGGLNAFSYKSSQNLCSAPETDTSIGDIKSCTQKTECSPGNTVMFCNSYSTYGNDQHSWPKNGGDDILDFFREIDEYSKK